MQTKESHTPYDIWDGCDAKTRQRRLHPSKKRTKKNALPHPGQSYNPDPKDHSDLLKKIALKELKYQKEQRSLNKSVDIKVSKKELHEDTKEELESGIKHLIDGEDDEGSSTDEAFSDYDEKDFAAIVKDKKVEEKRKSRQQRMRQLKDRLQRKAAKLRKLKNIRLSKIDAVKKITKEIEKKEKEAASKRKRHPKIKGERLGQRFEPSDPVYCLSSELPKNLRDVKCPMDSIVREQLESFQSRLLVEPTTYQEKKRKYKKREFDKYETE